MIKYLDFLMLGICVITMITFILIHVDWRAIIWCSNCFIWVLIAHERGSQHEDNTDEIRDRSQNKIGRC